MLVIHQLDYSHGQYSAFLPKHLCDSKSCSKAKGDGTKNSEHNCHNHSNNREGECDFLVVGQAFVAVFEVKATILTNMEDQDISGKIDRFDVCYSAALKQRKRMIDLLLVNSFSDDNGCSVETIGFTVFSNISRDEFDNIILKNSKKELSSYGLLFSDDLKNFTRWFLENLASQSPSRTTYSSDQGLLKKIKCCLLGLWCMDNKNKWDETKCSLAKCVKDVDEKLRMGIFTEYEAKSVMKDPLALTSLQAIRKRVRQTTSSTCSESDIATVFSDSTSEWSSLVVGTDKTSPVSITIDVIADSTDIFKKYLNIRCLSEGQRAIFDSNERFLWVNGPAGSGKTLVILGKILQMVRTPYSGKKIILMCPDLINCTAVRRHQKFLEEIKDVPYEIMESVDTDFDGFKLKIAKSDSKVILLKSRCSKDGSFIMMLQTLIQLQQGKYHIIVDDFQLDKFWTDSSEDPEVITGFITAMDEVKKQPNDEISVWVFCDLVQQILYETLYNASHIKKLNEDHRNKLKANFVIKSLEANLRNTCDIATLLDLLRNKFTEMVKPSIAQQEIGHFLRGTKPLFYLIEDATHDFSDIIRTEINKLDGLGNNDIGVLYSGRTNIDHKFLGHPKSEHQNDIEKIIETVSKGKGKAKVIIDVERIEDSWSAEWPAVIAIIHGSVRWSELYLAVSRARVYTSVIILGSGNESEAGAFLKYFELCNDVCKVITIKNQNVQSSENIEDF